MKEITTLNNMTWKILFLMQVISPLKHILWKLSNCQKSLAEIVTLQKYLAVHDIFIRIFGGMTINVS